MGIRYVIEVVADSPDQAVQAESVLLRLPELGIFTSAVSVTDTSTGTADDYERKYPLNVHLVRAYADAKNGGK